MDAWKSRFGFLWYNDDEIFRYTRDDFHKQAEELAGQGINHVITFSGTHFRWSFRRHWKLINDTIAKVCEACHANGILVTEHHSSHLTFNPLNQDDEKYMEQILSKRRTSSAVWDHFREDCDADPLIGEHRLSSFRQIDGRTGEWARSTYRGYAMCFNNPNYRAAYFAYLEDVYKTGVDGIMTDDVQYFALDPVKGGTGHACACPWCRQLFREESGYELPEPGESWDKWHGNYDDPSFREWILFKIRSTENFHKAVADHYEGLGLKLLRPGYISTALSSNPTCYVLETVPRLDWIFTENTFSSVIRYSWPNGAVEAAHRSAVGRIRKIPAMSLFYPERRDDMEFAWALAVSWGHLFLATPEGGKLPEGEKRLRDFEKRYDRLLHNLTKTAEVCFYDSPTNRILYKDSDRRSLSGLKTWAQACIMNSVQFEYVQESGLENLKVGQVLVLNEIALMSDSELKKISVFLESGGTVVWIGATASFDEKGEPREQKFSRKFPILQEIASVDDGENPRQYAVGKGRVSMLPGDRWLGPVLYPRGVDRWSGTDTQSEIVEVEYQQIHEEICTFLDSVIPGGRRIVTNANPGILITQFRNSEGADILHLVNTTGTLIPEEGNLISHADPIPFPESEQPVEIELRGQRADGSGKTGTATLYSPWLDHPENIPLTVRDNTLTITIPAVYLQKYAAVAITDSTDSTE